MCFWGIEGSIRLQEVLLRHTQAIHSHQTHTHTPITHQAGTHSSYIFPRVWGWALYKTRFDQIKASIVPRSSRSPALAATATAPAFSSSLVLPLLAAASAFFAFYKYIFNVQQQQLNSHMCINISMLNGLIYNCISLATKISIIYIVYIISIYPLGACI